MGLSVQRNRKVIFVDPSIKSIGGHYYEYARSMIDTLEKNQCEVIILGNRALERENLRSNVKPGYQFDFFQGHSPLSFQHLDSIAGNKLAQFRKLAVKQYFSDSAAQIDSPRVPARSMARIHRLPMRLLQRLEKLSKSQNTIGRFRNKLEMRLTRAMVVRDLTQTTIKLLKQEDVRAGDIIFWPTSSENELEAVLNVLDREPAFRACTWKLLFRRPLVSRFAEVDLLRAIDQVRSSRLGRVFQRAANSPHKDCLKYLTDTEFLREQYELLGYGHFGVVPIPHTQSSLPPSDSDTASSRFHSIYVGDARTEKGYGALPDLVGAVREKCGKAGNLTFAIQSNYNVAGGEPAVVVAKQRLLAEQADVVTLIDRAQTGDAYWDMLRSADVNLLLYDEVLYSERSSGILAESLAVGLPVIIPSGTWLEAMLAPAINSYQKNIVAQCTPKESGTLSQNNKQLSLRGEGHLLGDDLVLHPKGERCKIKVPVAATGDFIQIKIELSKNERYFDFEMTLDFCGPQREVLKKVRRVFRSRRDAAREMSVFFAVPQETSCIEFSFASLSKNAVVTLSKIEYQLMQYRAGAPLPAESTIGAVYGCMQEIPHIYAQMIAHRKHFRASAYEFSKAWGAEHNPASSVNMLLT